MIANLLVSIPDEAVRALSFADELIAVLGGITLGIGIAGRRIGWGPRCRKCKFDLRAVAETTTACPECGASLAARKSIEFGVRSRRWGMIVLGLAIVVGAAVSTMMNLPYSIINWREQVIAESFDLNAEIELALQGNRRALNSLGADLAGQTRRRGVRRAGSMPGQETLIALVDRMEQDPPTRAKLLPLILGPNALNTVMWVRDSVVLIRLAKVLADVATNDPALFDTLSPAGLAALCRTNSSGALDELLASPALVVRLYKGGSTEVRAMDTDHELILQVAPSFAGSNESVWMHQAPVVAWITAAEWRVQGEPDTAWKPAKRAARVMMSPNADVAVEGIPAQGAIEVRVRGNIIVGPAATKLRRTFPHAHGSDDRSLPAPELDDASKSIPFEWTQTIKVKPRSQLVLTPDASGTVTQWADETLQRTSLVKAPVAEAAVYRLLTELGQNINGAQIALIWTLEQSGKTWTFQENLGNGQPDMRVTAPEFNPDKPFHIHVHPDMAKLRERASTDSTFLDLRKTLRFDAVGKNIKEIKPLEINLPE